MTEHTTELPSSEAETTRRTSGRSILTYALTLFGTGVLFVVVVLLWLFQAPADFQDSITFTIEPGASIETVANQATAAGLVRSSLLLYTFLLLDHEPQDIHAGTYVLEGPMSVRSVANHLASKQTKLDLIRITLPEGLRAQYMADIIASSSPIITTEEYLALAQPHEGYLFPETYLVPPTMTAAELVSLQRDTFHELYTTLVPSASSTLTQEEVVILASIVEREANDETSMKMVAGIFMNRLDIGMALQADASIEYALDVPLNELRAGQLAAELRELDSPYNTYRNPGLPPTPIGNPGKQALDAVLNPTPSDYFYYLTGNDGTFYYAATLQEHNQNIARYLR